MQGLVDYHLHTAVTVDANMTEAEACQQAIALGLREIAFTNHVMLAQPDYLMSPEELAEHWAQIQVCQQRYPQLTIRLGLEMDYYEGREDEIAATIQRYEELIGRRFDFILGAVHQLNGVFFASNHHAPALFNHQQAESIYHNYFVLLTKAVRSGLFDVIAHPDVIKKYTGKFHPPVPFDRYRASVEAFIENLLETEVGIEVNPSGLRRPVAEIYLCPAQPVGRRGGLRGGPGGAPNTEHGLRATSPGAARGTATPGGEMATRGCGGEDAIGSGHAPATDRASRLACGGAAGELQGNHAAL